MVAPESAPCRRHTKVETRDALRDSHSPIRSRATDPPEDESTRRQWPGFRAPSRCSVEEHVVRRSQREQDRLDRAPGVGWRAFASWGVLAAAGAGPFARMMSRLFPPGPPAVESGLREDDVPLDVGLGRTVGDPVHVTRARSAGDGNRRGAALVNDEQIAGPGSAGEERRTGQAQDQVVSGVAVAAGEAVGDERGTEPSWQESLALNADILAVRRGRGRELADGSAWRDRVEAARQFVGRDQIAAKAPEARRGDGHASLDARGRTRQDRDMAAAINCKYGRPAREAGGDKQPMAKTSRPVKGDPVLKPAAWERGKAADVTATRRDLRDAMAAGEP